MLGVVTLALNLYTFKRVTYPGFVAEHRFRQETRLRPDGWTLPWPLCWLCWFHLQRLAPTAVRTHRRIRLPHSACRSPQRRFRTAQ